MISPTNKASHRTKNRIREHGPVFTVEVEGGSPDQWLDFARLSWLVRSEDGWLGWLPRDEFHVECVGKKFIEKVLG